MVKLTGISSKVRQIAVKNIGRDEPTLLITHDLATPARDLFARYAERMMVENELDAYISGFHLDALTSGVPLNVDLDTTLTVVAGNLYRLLALKLDPVRERHPRQDLAATSWTPPAPCTSPTTGVTCALNLRSHHPVLIDAGFADLEVPDPLVGRPHPAVPIPATIITRPQGTSTQLPDRESRLARMWRFRRVSGGTDRECRR